jgi:hypothetical protein
VLAAVVDVDGLAVGADGLVVLVQLRVGGALVHPGLLLDAVVPRVAGGPLEGLGRLLEPVDLHVLDADVDQLVGVDLLVGQLAGVERVGDHPGVDRVDLVGVDRQLGGLQVEPLVGLVEPLPLREAVVLTVVGLVGHGGLGRRGAVLRPAGRGRGGVVAVFAGVVEKLADRFTQNPLEQLFSSLVYLPRRVILDSIDGNRDVLNAGCRCITS